LDQFGYAEPFADRQIRSVGGLHIKRSSGVDLNTGTASVSELYVLAVGPNPLEHHDTIAYNPVSGRWTDSLDDSVPDPQQNFDMINTDRYTFSVYGNKLRGVAEPIRLDFQIGDFVGGLSFQGLHDLVDLALDDHTVPNPPWGLCPKPHLDGVPVVIPLNQAGTLSVMSDLRQLAWRDGGLLLEAGGPSNQGFLTNVDLALLDLEDGCPDPDNDGDGILDAADSCPNEQEDFDRVDFRDVSLVARALGSSPGQPRWNPAADLNHNGRVELGDLFIVVRSSLDQTCQP